MKNFIFLYKGNASVGSPADDDEENEAWVAWIDDCGDAIIDAGSPIGNGVSIVDDGTEDDAEPITGYSIIQAHNMAEAKQLTIGHPHLINSEGDCSIEIYEIFPFQL